MGAATPKMKEFAQAIANYIDIEEPDYSSFMEVSKFIDDHKAEYYEERRAFGDFD